MGKYLMLWEVNTALVSVDPKERAAGFGKLMQMVEQDLKEGAMKDWGSFVAEERGYAVMEGKEVEVLKRCQRYVPMVRFEVHPIASASQIEEMLASMSG